MVEVDHHSFKVIMDHHSFNEQLLRIPVVLELTTLDSTIKDSQLHQLRSRVTKVASISANTYFTVAANINLENIANTREVIGNITTTD